MHGSAPEAGASLADLADPKQLGALRPAHRLFRAHPVLGLEEANSGWLFALEPQQLGVSWFALPSGERRRREADFLRALLRRAARYENARFEAGWGPAEDERHATLARRCAADVSSDGTVRGPLTPRAIEALVQEMPGMLVVDGGPQLTIVTMDGVDALGVWIDPWKRAALERQLEAEWWPATRPQGASRERHAYLYVGWHRLKSPLYALLAGGLAALAWGDGLVAELKAVGTACFVLVGLDVLFKCWWRRASARGDID